MGELPRQVAQLARPHGSFIDSPLVVLRGGPNVLVFMENVTAVRLSRLRSVQSFESDQRIRRYLKE